MGFKTITNPTGAFGYTDLQTEVGQATVALVSTGAITGPACVSINTTGTGIATAATDGTASLVVGIVPVSLTTNQVGLVQVYGMAENVPCNGTVAAGDLLKRSVTTAGYVAATATPAVGEVVGVAINASASNTVDVWIKPAALSLNPSPAVSTSFSVANINPGVVRAEFMRSILKLITHEHALQHQIDPLVPRVQFDQFLDRFSGPYLDDERNRCIEWFLNETTSDRLLFVDSDISFEPHHAFDLIQLAHEHELALLGGVYYNAWSSFPGDGPGEGIGPVAYRWQERVDQPPYLEKLTVKEIVTHPDPIMEVDAMGTGFMSIHRDLINLIGQRYLSCTPWFAEVSLHGVHMGEDMTFCCRALELGHQPHIAPQIAVDHYKIARIRPMPQPED